MAKRRAEASREGEDKPFVGSVVNNANEQLCRRGNPASDVSAPLPNHMLDSPEGYLNNIATAATQAVIKFGPLAELSVILEISIDIVASQQK